MILPDLRALVEAAPVEELPRLAGALAEAQAALAMRLAQPNGSTKESAAEDVSLDVEVAAQRLGVSKCWLYRHAAELPFAVRVGRRVTFSSRGLERWRQRRMGV